MYLISSSVNADYMILAVIMLINSAIAVYYYLKPIIYIFFKDPIQNHQRHHMTNATISTKSIVAFCAVLSVFSIFLIDPLLDIISYYVNMAGY